MANSQSNGSLAKNESLLNELLEIGLMPEQSIQEIDIGR